MWAYVNWIDVHRAMPTRPGEYLGVMPIPDRPGLRRVRPVYFGRSGSFWAGAIDQVANRVDGEVTYWAELPAPPPESIRDVLARERAVAAIDRGERAAAG